LLPKRWFTQIFGDREGGYMLRRAFGHSRIQMRLGSCVEIAAHLVGDGPL